jgi:ASC-1-like (ASCH) protein
MHGNHGKWTLKKKKKKDLKTNSKMLFKKKKVHGKWIDLRKYSRP